MNLIGQSLGRYHILEQLGEGGMAIVYKAYDTRLETDVAVKVIRTENLPQSAVERALKRFEREAKALAKLTHPNIVPIIDYGEYAGSPYLVMKYLPGGTLKQLLGHPMPYQEAARILAPIAHALEYAHQHDIVHRDVKPSNILITESGQPMLSDFGVAKILETDETMDLTGTSMGVGTPEYMAPEQVTSRTTDARADIYSLGIVFFELVTGRKPFVADTPMAVLFKQASEPLPRPRQFALDLPQAVEKVLFKALAKKPEDRYQDAAAFAEALEQLGRSEMEHGRWEAVKEAPRAKRMMRLVGGLIGLVVLVVGIGLGILLMRPGGRAAPASFTTSRPVQTGGNPIVISAPTQGMPTTFSILATSPSISTTTVNSNFSFSQNFDDGSLDGFTNITGLWVVVSETNGNKVLDVNSMDSPNEHPSIEFGDANWRDFIFESRINMLDYSPSNDAPLTSIFFRGNYWVAFTPYWKGFDLIFNPPWTVISGRTIETKKNTWYTVRIEANGNQINVFLDGKLTISDMVSRESSGLFGFDTWPGTHVQFDDIVIKPINK